jgi:hypothetical protein
MSEKAGLSVKKFDSKEKGPVSSSSKTGLSQSMEINSPVEQVLHLQRTIGNRAVTRLIQSGVLQAKLKIGQPGDVYEQEADRLADQVMRMSGGSLARKEKGPGCPGCSEKEELFVQAGGSCGQSSDISSCVESHINALKGKGRPLSPAGREYFEPRFGSDFSRVRLHTGPDAAAIATEINARAFTRGNEIFFGAGQYSPGTSSGKHLLAHELTHVVQQGTSKDYSISRIKVSRLSKSVISRQTDEREAEIERAEAVIEEAEAELRNIQVQIVEIIGQENAEELTILLIKAATIRNKINDLIELLDDGSSRETVLASIGGGLVVGMAVPLPEEVVTWPLAGLAALAVLLFTASQASVSEIKTATDALSDAISRLRQPCPPCPPNPPPEIDLVPPSRPHFPCPGDHWHYQIYNQNPITCTCFLSGRLFGGCCGQAGAPC